MVKPSGADKRATFLANIKSRAGDQPAMVPGKTGMNVILDFTGRLKAAEAELIEEQTKLRAFEGAVPARKIGPDLIDTSEFANRHEDSFESDAFGVLIEEIKVAGGNTQPVKVRPKAGGRYETIFGHRRIEACRRLGLEVFALVEEVNDKQLWLEMTRENEARADLSPFEMSMHYKAAIEKGLYKNWSELAEALGKSRQTLSRFSLIADLPRDVVKAFASPLQITTKNIQVISSALANDDKGVLLRARSLHGKNATAKQVVDHLVGEQFVSPVRQIELAYGSITRAKNKISLKVDTDKLTAEQIDRLYAFLQKL